MPVWWSPKMAPGFWNSTVASEIPRPRWYCRCWRATSMLPWRRVSRETSPAPSQVSMMTAAAWRLFWPVADIRHRTRKAMRSQVGIYHAFKRFLCLIYSLISRNGQVCASVSNMQLKIKFGIWKDRKSLQGFEHLASLVECLNNSTGT